MNYKKCVFFFKFYQYIPILGFRTKKGFVLKFKKIFGFLLTPLDSDDNLKYAIYNIVFILRSRKLNIVGQIQSSVNEQTDMLGENYELAEMETDSPDVQPGVVTVLGNPDNVADGRR